MVVCYKGTEALDVMKVIKVLGINYKLQGVKKLETV